MMKLRVDSEIARAATLPGELYSSEAWFLAQRERVFARSWQITPDTGCLTAPGEVFPWVMLPGFLDEPLLLTRDERGELHCLSNVCTHRGNIVVDRPGCLKRLRCGYHGRRFSLNGAYVSMPEFEGVEGFPSVSDDLPRVELRELGPLRFASLDPAFDFEEWIGPVRQRVEELPFERLRWDEQGSRDYTVRANWALYCDNYLEGFHIPYVHPALNEQLDYASYATRTFPLASLQLGIARDGEATFELPAGHADAGQAVAAFYFFLFPNLMLNFYPWGLSVNVVEPLGVSATRVRFLSYVAEPSKREVGPGAGLHRVELEDEAVVESCQRGVRSRLYRRGRYSPTREGAVHHFHRLLTSFLS